MSLHQISKREGGITRVQRGVTPVVELNLEPGERVVSIDLRPAFFDDLNRKTVDWRWTAYIDHDLGEPAA